MALSPLFVEVESSILPSVRRVLVSRCPPSAQSASPPLYSSAASVISQPNAETVALVEEPAAPEGEQSQPFDETIPVEPEGAKKDHLAIGIGGNLLAGSFYGLLHQLLRPGMSKAVRRAGRAAPIMDAVGQAGIMGLACAAAGVCRQASLTLGSLATKVPLLGDTGPVGGFLQWGLGTLIGSRIGALLTDDSQMEEVQGVEGDPNNVFLANMCVMCNQPYTIGSGDKVAAFSCGHACLCAGDADCVQTYLAVRNDCPLCRTPGVHTVHTLCI